MWGDRAIRKLLTQTVGPAPWYWQTFPSIEVRGRQYHWHHDPNLNGSVMLVSRDRPEQTILSVAMYTRVFFLPPGLLGLWFDDGPALRVVALDPDKLEEFAASTIKADSHPKGYFNQGDKLLGEFRVDCNLDEGDHVIELPLAFSGMESLLMVGAYEKVQEAACAAIFEIKPGTRAGSHRVTVYPQKWFNRDDFDLGYEWITRVARDPRNGRLIGDGIRISPFVLREDGMHLDRWLKT